MNGRGTRLVFVHPFAGAHDDTIPFGVVGLMNAVPEPKLGLFAHELTDGLLRDSTAVALDVHWVHSLAPAREIARELRRVAPHVVVIMGGYVATIFAEQLVEQGVADYVVRGDAERPFAALVAALRSGDDPTTVPNLVARQGKTPWTYTVTPADFDRADYLTIDWFPSLRHRVHLDHVRPKRASDFPLVVTHKGCRSHRRGSDPLCERCHGQPDAQQRLRRGGFVHRSAARVMQDLARLSADRVLRRAMLVYDVDGLGEEYGHEIFSQRYDLDLRFEPTRFFSPELLARVAACFRSVDVALYYADMAESVAAGDRRAIDFLKRAQRLHIPVTLFSNRATAAAVGALADRYGYTQQSVEDELVDAPDPFVTPAAARRRQYARTYDWSEAYAVLKLVCGVSSRFLDAIALDLGLLPEEAKAAAERHVERALPEPEFRLADNPIRRHLTRGGNPHGLHFEVAPFVLPDEADLRSLMRVPKSWLLASPSRLGQLRFRLGQPESIGLSAEWRMVRSGNPDAVAVNVVSDEPDLMRRLRYDTMWKLCLPLHQRFFVRRGQHITVDARIVYRLDPPFSMRFGLAADRD